MGPIRLPWPVVAHLKASAGDQAGMAGKIDRALGAFCILFAGFFFVAARALQPSDASGLTSTASLVTLAIALLAAVPGIWLLVKGRSI
ncbi:MAG TPA: hypothetical protein VM370_05570 [Candidatus Thermoplasmatota archaeon]|nr:hypothetical protein [Candidatus Thermoplasmatota archaeon]